MDFSIPEDLRSLGREQRRLIDTELKPLQAVIEEERRIPSQALDAMLPGTHGGLGLDTLASCLLTPRTHVAYFHQYSINIHTASKGFELHGSQTELQRGLARASGRAAAALIGPSSPALYVDPSALGADSCECPFALAPNH